MDNEEFKAIRRALGLSGRQLAHLLETDARSIRSIESPPSASSSRTVAPRMAQCMAFYMAGYLPEHATDDIVERVTDSLTCPVHIIGLPDETETDAA